MKTILNCRQVTRFLSQSMDARLPWHRRLAVRLHLLYCVWCRRYGAQLQFLRRAGRQLGAQAPDSPVPRLPDEAKEQMAARLREALRNPPASPQ